MTFDAEKALVVQSTCARELKANADSNRVIGTCGYVHFRFGYSYVCRIRYSQD